MPFSSDIYQEINSLQFELKEIRRRQEEDEQRRREEISRHSAGADKTDGEKSEAGSIRSGGKKDRTKTCCRAKIQWANINLVM